jgi:hypothetical protein
MEAFNNAGSSLISYANTLPIIDGSTIAYREAHSLLTRASNLRCDCGFRIVGFPPFPHLAPPPPIPGQNTQNCQVGKLLDLGIRRAMEIPRLF